MQPSTVKKLHNLDCRLKRIFAARAAADLACVTAHTGDILKVVLSFSFSDSKVIVAPFTSARPAQEVGLPADAVSAAEIAYIVKNCRYIYDEGGQHEGGGQRGGSVNIVG